MTVDEFGARVASAFFLWPKELLDTELNRSMLASTVQHDLFGDNPDGRKAYVVHMQPKISWFGAALPELKRGAPEEPASPAASNASPVEASVEAAPLAEWDGPDEKKGWPWPQPGSTSSWTALLLGQEGTGNISGRITTGLFHLTSAEQRMLPRPVAVIFSDDAFMVDLSDGRMCPVMCCLRTPAIPSPEGSSAARGSFIFKRSS
jgi:hypothetical protein